MTIDPNTSEQPVENKTAEYNFAQLRKQLENERYAREQAEMRAKQYEQEKKEWETSKNKEVEEDSYDEPYVDEKRLEKKFKDWSQNIDKTIDERAEVKARLLLEQERQSNFLKEHKDFDQIMNQEIIQKFVDAYPDMAEGILNMPDDFNRKKHVYKTIKSLKLHIKEDPIEKQIHRNQTSGLYQPSNVAPSPYKANGDFSKAGQQQAYEQMQELASRFGGGGVNIPGMGMR